MPRNPFDEYRRIQRELRREYDRFTRAHCATCETPCCRRPARIVPTDILLAQGTGWRGGVEALAGSDPVQHVAAQATLMLGPVPEDLPDEPCEYLGAKGCSFPPDVRPFGCTAWICPPMFAKMDRSALARVKRLVRELTRAHDELMAAVHAPREGAAEEL